MSSGKDHARASKFIAPVAAFGTGAFVHWASDDLAWAALAAAGGLVGCALVGQVLSPDLDQEDLTRSDWIVLRRLGPFAGLWLAYFYPYAWLIPHRSAISHFPVISTAIRIIYLCAPLWFIRDWIAAKMTVEIAVFLTGCLTGLMVSDTAHYYMDLWSTSKKRKARAK